VAHKQEIAAREAKEKATQLAQQDKQKQKPTQLAQQEKQKPVVPPKRRTTVAKKYS
jgi:hypothetical protein